MNRTEIALKHFNAISNITYFYTQSFSRDVRKREGFNSEFMGKTFQAAQLTHE